MVSGRYLAMRLAEFNRDEVIPGKNAWMVSPFSPEWKTPLDLAPSSLLILTDEEIPVKTDPEQVCQQVRAMNCAGVVLDFQKAHTERTAAFAARLVASLPCPVVVSESYAAGLKCPVFLSPCPHHVHLMDHLGPWADREVWLDLALDAEVITLTKDGAATVPCPLPAPLQTGHLEPHLHCHYTIETGEDFARFTLWRTKEDVDALAKDAEELGVKTFIGLWQELI